MEKKTMYIAIFAVVIVALFIIEPFAIGMLQSAGKAQGASGEGSASSSLDGTASASITIVRYEPYLIVSGNASGIEAVKERLVAEGLATYAMWSGDSMVLSLKSSKDVPAAASEFEEANASALATAYISTSPKVTVTGGDGAVSEAEGTSMSMQMRPVYEEGSTHEAQFAVRVDGGQVTGMGSVSIMPSVVSGAQAEAMVSSPPQATYSVAVAWKGRAMAKQLAAESGAAYKERSFVYAANASKEALDIAVAGNPYVTGTQPGIVSVQNSYTDSEEIGRALLAGGYAAVFPDSIATFSNGSGRQAAEALVANLTAANISASLSADWAGKILVPSVLSKDGRSYFGPSGGIELLIEGTGAPAENVTSMNVSVDFEAAGSRIVRVTAVNPA